jgi:dTDP-glucose 4,6-dehydratase
MQTPVPQKRILITGGAGFAGHHLVEHVLRSTDWKIIVLDRLSYAANGFDRLRDIEAFDDRRVLTLTADFSQSISAGVAREIGQVDYIIHMGAETHVDNSISDPLEFVTSNVVGTLGMLQFAKSQEHLAQFVYFSTDEVFGPAPDGTAYKEWDRYDSRNPYAATKAGGEELALSFANTYGIPVLITHTMNLIGERQHPEKFIPKVVRKVIAGELVEIHSDPARTRAGSRFYLHCRNMASALLYVLGKGQIERDKINIVGEKEIDNLSLAQSIASIIGKPLKYEMVDFHSSRPGHDLRYALDGTKLTDMGWKIPINFEDSLDKTIRWMIDHPRWLSW